MSTIQKIAPRTKLTLAAKMVHAIRTSMGELGDDELSTLMADVAKEFMHRSEQNKA